MSFQIRMLLAATFAELETIRWRQVRSAAKPLLPAIMKRNGFGKDIPVQEISGQGLYELRNARYQYDPEAEVSN